MIPGQVLLAVRSLRIWRLGRRAGTTRRALRSPRVWMGEHLGGLGLTLGGRAGGARREGPRWLGEVHSCVGKEDERALRATAIGTRVRIVSVVTNSGVGIPRAQGGELTGSIQSVVLTETSQALQREHSVVQGHRTAHLLLQLLLIFRITLLLPLALTRNLGRQPSFPSLPFRHHQVVHPGRTSALP